MFKVNKGFTLLELIIVVVIIGILASLATPRFFKAAERARMAEGVHVLGLVRLSQIRYYVENQSYLTGNDLSGLDLELTVPRFFTPEGADDAGATNYVTKVTRKDEPLGTPYNGGTMQMNIDGVVAYDGTIYPLQ